MKMEETFPNQEKKQFPTNEKTLETSREEKIRAAEMTVAEMFGNSMEVIGRIKGNPYFETPRN